MHPADLAEEVLVVDEIKPKWQNRTSNMVSNYFDISFITYSDLADWRFSDAVP
jgi:hypothetical protein